MSKSYFHCFRLFVLLITFFTILLINSHLTSMGTSSIVSAKRDSKKIDVTSKDRIDFWRTSSDEQHRDQHQADNRIPLDQQNDLTPIDSLFTPYDWNKSFDSALLSDNLPRFSDDLFSNSICDLGVLLVEDETKTDSLSESDCFAAGGRYVDVYHFPGFAGQRVKIVMESPDFTTLLNLSVRRFPLAIPIAENSGGGGGNNSLIEFTLPSEGIYFIIATSRNLGVRNGSYRLTLSTNNCPVTSIPSVPMSQPRIGSLDRLSDCISSRRTLYDDYTFIQQSASNAAYRIRMASTAFNTYLELYDPSGQLLEFNNDHDGTNSEISFIPTTPGRYTVRAASHSPNETGSYSIIIDNIFEAQNFNITGNLYEIVDVTQARVRVSGSLNTECSINPSTRTYTCSHLPTDGNYTITPTHPAAIFTPRSRSHDNLRANLTNQFFTAANSNAPTRTIRGKVMRNGSGLSGVKMTLSGNGLSTGERITAADGTYSFTALTNGASYTLTPSLTGHTFSPSSQTFDNIATDQTDINFTSSSPFKTRFDFDGDSKADISVYRPSAGAWYLLNSSTNAFSGTQFGISSDKLAPADFDADGRTDISVFRDGFWYRINSSNNQFVAVQWGQSGDVPVPADYDGDSKADIAVFRPSNGTWYRINSSTNQVISVQFGINTDKPVMGDFDGDNKTDVAVYRSSSGAWYILRSSDNAFQGISFGIAEDIPTPADYDADGRTDISVYRPSTGSWFRINSSTNQFFGQQFGVSSDIPVAADYDGDAKADIAVFRPSSGSWYIQKSGSGFTGLQFGVSTDKAVPASFLR